jgi:hypothetical protein
MTTAAQAIKTIISADGRTAMISIPVTFRLRSGRKQILSPPGASPWSPAPRADTALVKAIVRAHRWRNMIESGEYPSQTEMARAEKINESYLGRMRQRRTVAVCSRASWWMRSAELPRTWSVKLHQEVFMRMWTSRSGAGASVPFSRRT